MKLAAHPLLARQARLARTVTVLVDIDADGKVDRVFARSHLNHGVMLVLIEKTIRSSAFKTGCARKQVTIEYEFFIGGDPSDLDQQEVAFGFPNRIWISTRPPHFQPIEH
jgi:hypothetical protein